MAEPRIPAVDILGDTVRPREETSTGWAVLVDCDINGVPGPHLLSCEQGETHARRRLCCHHHKRPDADPQLIRQDIVTAYGPWHVAADQPGCPVGQP